MKPINELVLEVKSKCKTCGETDVDKLCPCKRMTSGYLNCCRACNNKVMMARRRKKGVKERKIVLFPTCPICAETNPDKFYIDLRTKTCYMSLCKACSQSSSIKRLYGLDILTYRALVKLPCEICGQITKKQCIDHTINGTHHGVLCTQCNTGIGMLKHDTNIMSRAIEYVARTRKGDS